MRLTRRGFTLAAAAGAGSLLAPRALAAPNPWRRGPDLPIPLQEIYPARLDGTIYVAGGLTVDGEGGGATSDRVFRLEADWREAAPLPIPAHHPNCVGLNGRLYAIGGFTAQNGGAWSMTEAVWIYDADADAWSAGPALPAPYGETTTGVLGGRIHVATGRQPRGEANSEWGDHGDVAAHYVFDPSAGAWETARPAPTARNSAAGAVVDGKLHVISGRTVAGGNTPIHEVYDPVEDRWETRAPSPQPRRGPAGAGGAAAAAFDGKIYVFGGEWFDSDGGGVYAQDWVYDPARDAWASGQSALISTPTARHGLGALTLGEDIWVIGGSEGPGLDRTARTVEIYAPREWEAWINDGARSPRAD